MTPKKPAPKTADRAAYDAARPAPRSGSHNKPGFMLRAPEAELEAATRAAERLGVTRNDLARAALRVFSREAADVPRAAETALKAELEEMAKRRPPG
jgi:hypothetical protein